MKITLAKVKIVDRLSEETLCYTADILLDGKKVGTASNRGTGGGDDYYFTDRAVQKQIEDYCKTLPPVPNPYDLKRPFDNNLEMFIGGLLEEFEKANHEKKVLAQKKRWCKGATNFRLIGDKPGSYRVIKVEFNQAVKDKLVKQYGDKIEEILNETIPA